MEESIKTEKTSKKFITKDKVKTIICVGASAVALATTFVATAAWIAVGFHNDFLEEQGLSDEFHEFLSEQ